MNCPPEVAEVLLEILRVGLLRIRAAGWSKNSSRCAIEADHLHNVPGLLDTYSLERLKYYWEAEKPSFERQLSPGDLAFQSAWGRLESILSAVPV
jgi:hypothetical protein